MHTTRVISSYSIEAQIGLLASIFNCCNGHVLDNLQRSFFLIFSLSPHMYDLFQDHLMCTLLKTM